MPVRLRVVSRAADEAADAADDAGACDAVDPTEESVARAALAGDAGAWATLIARHSHKLVVALLGRGVPLERAKELAQETWLRLMERQREGKLSALTLPGLAIVQAGFLATNEWRREQRTDPRPWEVVLSEPLGPTLEQGAIDRERLARMSTALAACPARARQVFAMVYDHPELTYAEIAGRVGLSVQRVKQIVFEVRRRLRAALAEDAT